MKQCFKCGSVLPISEFYKHPRMKDGHLNKCKECAKLDVARRIVIKKQDVQWVLHERERCRIKARKYGTTPASVDLRRATLQKYDERFPEKRAAQGIVARALRSGKLIKQSCSVCGSDDSEAHHEDYSKPLDVIWLCPRHHADVHILAREAELLIR